MLGSLGLAVLQSYKESSIEMEFKSETETEELVDDVAKEKQKTPIKKEEAVPAKDTEK